MQLKMSTTTLCYILSMQPIGVYLNDNLNFSTQSVASKFDHKMNKKDRSVYQSVAKFISLFFFSING